MEIECPVKRMEMRRFTWMVGVLLLSYACSRPLEEPLQPLSRIIPGEHTLLAINPDLSLVVGGDSLNVCYPRLRTGETFPITGILQVDGKKYRFMGGDSLRISALAPLSTANNGWESRYTYLFPGKEWTALSFPDAQWKEGEGAFGRLLKGEYPVHTAWGAKHIYVRRYIDISQIDSLRGHKLYVRYHCDDDIQLYCNGNRLFTGKLTEQIECHRLSDKAFEHLVSGKNVLAAHGYNDGGSALLDFGLYIENKKYSDVEPAILKDMDVQATCTRYLFHCGDTELQLNFISPSLSEQWDMAGWSIGLISYQVHAKNAQEVSILFDMDTEGKQEIHEQVEQSWRFAEFGRLHLGMPSNASTCLVNDGHVVLSQQLNAENKGKGVLLMGYDDDRILQYDGELMYPLRYQTGTKEMNELMKRVGEREDELNKECERQDTHYNTQAFQIGGKPFAERMLPAYRSFMATHRFVLGPDKQPFCLGDTLGHVKMMYHSFPILLFFKRADRMKALLNPIFTYCRNPYWLKSFPPYDLGLYPVAGKQVHVENEAVQTAANMLMMTSSLTEMEQKTDYADKHWEQLTLWAAYLQERMEKMMLATDTLLDPDDERVKCVLGLMAYRKLMKQRRGHGQD